MSTEQTWFPLRTGPPCVQISVPASRSRKKGKGWTARTSRDDRPRGRAQIHHRMQVHQYRRQPRRIRARRSRAQDEDRDGRPQHSGAQIPRAPTSTSKLSGTSKTCWWLKRTFAPNRASSIVNQRKREDLSLPKFVGLDTTKKARSWWRSLMSTRTVSWCSSVPAHVSTTSRRL